jgi:Ala-tRNA(Pro) deacylase
MSDTAVVERHVVRRAERVRDLLEREGVPFEAVNHGEAWTAQEAAAASHVSGREVAKSVVLRDACGAYVLAVVPASRRIDLELLSLATGRGPFVLATEPELDLLFPDCERGALPPFGELYGLDTYVDACLPRAREIFFPAGSRHQLLGVPYAEFARVARAQTGQFCFHR